MKKQLHCGLYSFILLMILLILTVPQITIATQTNSGSKKQAKSLISDLYFLSIGSKHYLQTERDSFKGFITGGAPVHSATQIAETLHRLGARYGILLTSDNDHYVSRNDIRQAIIDLKRKIRSDEPKLPLIIFYYMGHGIGDSYSKNLYLTPGNLLFQNKTNSQTMTIPLLKATVSNLDVINSLAHFKLHKSMTYLDTIFMSDLTVNPISPTKDLHRYMELIMELEKQHSYNLSHNKYPKERNRPIPYIAMFDNCYGDVLQDLIKQSAGEKPAISLNETGHDTKKLNSGIVPLIESFAELAQNKMNKDAKETEDSGLVLYATAPGKGIGDFADPNNNFYRVGALSRRFLLTIEELKNEKVTTLKSIRRHLGDKSLDEAKAGDNATPVPYSISATKENILKLELPLKFTNQQKPIEKRLGSTKKASYCCGM